MNFRNESLWRHLAAEYTIIMSRLLKVTSNHVMYDRGAWSRALCCLPSVKKQKHNIHFFPVKYIIKQLLFGFCDIQNNQGFVKGWYGLPRPWLFWISQIPHPIIVYKQRANTIQQQRTNMHSNAYQGYNNNHILYNRNPFFHESDRHFIQASWPSGYGAGL